MQHEEKITVATEEAIKADLQTIMDDFMLYYTLFYKFTEMSRPVITSKTERVEVEFNDITNTIDLKINPEWWASVTMDQKRFAVAHNCLHIFFQFGKRIKQLDVKMDKDNKALAGVAQDIVINQILQEGFRFDRKKSDPNDEFHWLDTTIDKNKYKVPKDANFEYYFRVLRDMVKDNPNGQKGGMKELMEGKGLVDGHDGHDSFDSDQANQKLVENFNPEDFKRVEKQLEKEGFATKPDQTEDFEDGEEKPGEEQGSTIKQIFNKFTPKKKRWETVIRNWCRRATEFTYVEQWLQKDRRWAAMSTELSIPSDIYREDELKNKIDVFFYMDTSGSCVDLADRFFSAARSVPLDRFNLRIFCFDTKVYETDLKSGKLFGFGGTSFDIIENHIQGLVKNERTTRYPSSVWVLTDGDGNRVEPQFPKRWNWFLSVDHRHCIPNDCNIFALKDFE